jgi:hypothetical protein
MSELRKCTQAEAEGRRVWGFPLFVYARQKEMHSLKACKRDLIARSITARGASCAESPEVHQSRQSCSVTTYPQ